MCSANCLVMSMGPRTRCEAECSSIVLQIITFSNRSFASFKSLSELYLTACSSRICPATRKMLNEFSYKSNRNIKAGLQACVHSVSPKDYFAGPLSYLGKCSK